MGFDVSAADLQPAVLNINKTDRLQNIMKWDANHLLGNAEYDAIAAFHVLEHLKNPEAAAEAYQIYLDSLSEGELAEGRVYINLGGILEKTRPAEKRSCPQRGRLSLDLLALL